MFKLLINIESNATGKNLSWSHFGIALEKMEPCGYVLTTDN